MCECVFPCYVQNSNLRCSFNSKLNESRKNKHSVVCCQTGVAVGVDWGRIRAWWAGINSALCEGTHTDWTFPCIGLTDEFVWSCQLLSYNQTLLRRRKEDLNPAHGDLFWLEPQWSQMAQLGVTVSWGVVTHRLMIWLYSLLSFQRLTCWHYFIGLYIKRKNQT